MNKFEVGSLIKHRCGDIGIILGLTYYDDGTPARAWVQWMDAGEWEPPYLESYKYLAADSKILEAE